MMNGLVGQRAHRILKHFDHYRPLYDASRAIPAYLQHIALQPGETLIGVYENLPGEEDEIIVITDLGIHLLVNEKWDLFRYDQINRVETPPSKEHVEGLTVWLISGREIWIPVKGGRGRARDVFEFLRFLDRVIDDMRRPS